MEPNTAKEFDTLPRVILTQGGEWDPTVLDHILTDDDDWVSKVKQDEDQEYDSPFDNRGEYKHKEPVRAGVPIENPTGPPSKDPDNIEVNFHSDEIEVNFHADDATRKVHQAYQEASNLNKTCVHEGEGMPDVPSSTRYSVTIFLSTTISPCIDQPRYTITTNRHALHCPLPPSHRSKTSVGPRD